MTVSGSVTEATSVSRQSRRNTSRTITASTPPIEDRVAHVGDRGGDELGEVVGLRQPQAGRQRLREVRERALDAGAHVEDVGADLLRDADVGDARGRRR